MACFWLSCASSNSLAKKGEFFDRQHFTEDAGEKFREAVGANTKNPRALADLALWQLKRGEAGLAEMILARACEYARKYADAATGAWALYARVLYRNGKIGAAEHALERGLAAWPNDRALLSAQEGIQREEAITRIRQDLRNRPWESALRADLAEHYLDAGWIHLALGEAKKLIQAGAANVRLLARIAHTLDEGGYYEYLPYWLEQLLRYDYRNAFALERLAKNALANEDFWQANTHFVAYMRHYPDDAAMLEEGGFLFLRIGKDTDGRHCLERAYARGRRSQRLLTTLGFFALHRDNKQDLAEKYFEEARFYLPDGEESEHKKTRLGLEVQRLRQYADFFQNEPQRLARVLTRIAEDFLELGDSRQALEEAKRVLELSPSSVPARIVKARAELALRQFEGALQTFRQAEGLDPENALVYWHLAQLYAELGTQNDELYERALGKAHAKNPKEARFCLALARHYHERGEHAKALEWYRRAEKIGPTDEISASIKREERALAERALAGRERSADGDSEELLSVALEYRERLGKAHPGYLRCADAASRLKPEHVGLHVLAADAALGLFAADTDYDTWLIARRHLDAALSQAPEDTSALAVKASLLRYETREEDPARVIGSLQRLDLSNSPYHYEDLLASFKEQDEAGAARYSMVAKILYNKNRDPAARLYLEKALGLANPRDAAEIRRALGRVLRDNGDYYAAAAAYEQALRGAFPAQHDYALIHLVVGNIYADIARSLPFSLAALRHRRPEATSAGAILALLPELTGELTAAIQKARQHYNSYIQQSSFGTQKTRGQALANALDAIHTTHAAMSRRISAMCAEQGEAELAIAILRQALEAKPNARDSRLVTDDLAELLAQSGRRDEANAVWEGLAKLSADDSLQRAHLRRLFAEGELDRAVEAFERAVRISPRESELHTLLAFLYWRQGAREKAIQALGRSLALDEGNIYALYYTFKIELEQDNIPKTVSAGEQVLRSFKKSMEQNYADVQIRDMYLDTLATLSRAHFRSGNVTRALEYAYEGIELDKEKRFGFLALAGNLRILQQKYDEAEDFYARAVEADPGNTSYKLRWAEACVFAEKQERALAILKELCDKETRFIKRQDVLLLYADLLAKRGEKKDAASVLKRLIREQAYNETGYLALSRLQAENNQEDDAIATLESGIAYIKDAPNLKDALAWLLCIARPDELIRARQIAMENVTTHPDTIDYRATLGYILLQLGQGAAAAKPIKLDEATRLASARPPRPADGNTIEAAMLYYRNDRFGEALDAIAGGEGSRSFMPTGEAAEKLFAALLERARP